jgi:hypothetical protein
MLFFKNAQIEPTITSRLGRAFSAKPNKPHQANPAYPYPSFCPSKQPVYNSTQIRV